VSRAGRTAAASRRGARITGLAHSDSGCRRHRPASSAFGPKPILSEPATHQQESAPGLKPPPTRPDHGLLLIGKSDADSARHGQERRALQAANSDALLLARVDPAGPAAADPSRRTWPFSYQARKPPQSLGSFVSRGAGQPWASSSWQPCCGLESGATPARYVVVPPGRPAQPWLMGWAAWRWNLGAKPALTDKTQNFEVVSAGRPAEFSGQFRWKQDGSLPGTNPWAKQGRPDPPAAGA